MRICLCLLVLLYPAISVASDSSKFRPASAAEIRHHLRRANNLSDTRDGYSYGSDSKLGYKISNGRVCVRYPSGQVDCVKMVSSGSRMQMIDRYGNREWLK